MTGQAIIDPQNSAGSLSRRRRMADIGTVGILFAVSVAAVLSRHFMYL